VPEAGGQALSSGVGADVCLDRLVRHGVGAPGQVGEPPGEELLLVPGDEHGGDVGLLEEPEVPQTARGDVHRAFQAEPGDGEVEQRQGCDALGVQPGEAESDHAADVVSDQAHRGGDVELFEELAHVLGWWSLP